MNDTPANDTETQASTGRPTPESFTDHCAYLRAMIAYLKRTQKQFSYRYFSRIAGYASPNFLKLVAEGQRQLSPDSIQRFADALGLDERERDQFEALVRLGQATNDAERNRFYGKLRRTADASPPALRLERAQYEVYSLWYAIPMRDLIAEPDFQEDPEWIARRMHPRIKASEAQRALSLLEQTGLVSRDASGRLVRGQAKIATAPKVRSLAVRNYHRAMLAHAAQALDGLPVESRDITSLTVAMSRGRYEAVCARVAAFREELLDFIEDSPDQSGADAPDHDAPVDREIFALGFQIVPVTQRKG
jgi:uncharacterized protein (TIGR02147 family)